MRRPMMAALAILFMGTLVLPGCFYVGPYGWWEYPDRDGGWEGHREGRGRRGELTPPHEGQRPDNHAGRGHDNNHDNNQVG